MTKYRNKKTLSGFKNAFRGILITVKSQKNFRTELLIALAVMIFTIILKFNPVETALIFISIGFVLFAELINTSAEYIIDTYFGNKYSEIAKISKDIAAGSVLIAVLTSISLGIILFTPKILNIIIK